MKQKLPNPKTAGKYLWMMMVVQLFCCNQLFAYESHAQSSYDISKVNVNLNLTEASLLEVFRSIQDQTTYTFLYENQLMGLDHKVTLQIDGQSLEKVLYLLAERYDLSFKQVNDRISVKSSRKKNIPAVIVEVTVRGRVVDEEGFPMPGVSVLVKGTQIGTVTNSEGEYLLENAPDDATLVFSFIGYLTQEIPLNQRSTLDVSLEPDTQQLDEVIVVGFGTQKKINVTGAVATVDGDQLMQRPVPNAASMLQGRMPGVRVVQNSGQPGSEGIGIQVRGQGTFSGAGSNPLVLIDGVEGNLNDIDPNDIENVSVLKDAASASIYGSRAANGVILITTKKGEKGRLRIDYNANYAIHAPTRMPELITNSAEYMEMWNEARLNSNATTGLYSQEQIDLYRNATDRNQYPNADWLDIMFNPAPTHTQNLSFSGGENLTSYNISLGYVNQEGVMKGFDFERYNFRINLSSGINENIKFGTNLFMKRGDRSNPRQGAVDTFLSTLSQAPTYRPTLPDGSGRYTFRAFDFESNNKNPVAIVENEVLNTLRDYSINAQAWTEFTLTEGLTWYTKAAIVGDFERSKDWRPEVPLYNYLNGEFMTDLDVGGRGLNVYNAHNLYTNLFSYFQYEKALAGNHNLNVQVGYSQEENNFEFMNGYRERFPSNILRELDAGSPAVQNSSGSSNSWAIQSLFGRLGYNFNEKYLLEFNMRYDGTSRLSPENRWGAFPSISAGWRLSQEDFIQTVGGNWLDDLKLRASYGELGNQNIGMYPYQDILLFTGAYPFDNSDLSTGVAQTRLTNQNIRWETTKITDIGLDMMIFNGLTLTVDWYRKVTSDILRSSQLTGVVGLDPPTINDGVMQNTGLEINLNYRNYVRNGRFEGLNYEAGFFIDRFRNELIEFGAEEISGYLIRREGLPWNSFFMLEQIGIFQSEEEINGAPRQFNDNTLPGDLRFRDQNGDGVINDDDRIVMGNPFPKFEYSFNFNASWKGFDMSVFLQGVHKRDIFVNNWGRLPFIQGSPPTVEWRERWTPENPSESMPRMYWGWDDAGKTSRNSSFFLEDASYMRIKNIVLGYTLPAGVSGRLGLSRVRAYLSGDNLFTVTNFPGLDPERTGSGNFVNYPQNKIYAFGLQVQL
ncbi:SusC/RagA family TonB-linked outer membrane protein [Negadavirga shengliensis]|uniref:SusC/RagA family TonB-linked outer membrane protein n=1 Tax=Negadavirga shengliensis TaxID=1389218 RepID=A0ABV9T2U0_9BACT